MFFNILNILSGKHFLRRKKFWRYCLSGLLTVAIVGAVARNLIAHAAIEQLGSFVLGNSVHVAQVEVGFKTVEITGLEVREDSLAGMPQLEIRALRLFPTIWRGLREGVWLRDVAVSEPTLHLRFDREGRLLSQFPKSSGAAKKPHLPFDRASVIDGALVIHQEGKPDFAIRGARLNAKVSQSIHLRASIADLLGGRLQVESKVDRSTLGGRTRVSLSSMQLDSDQLFRLPLAPSNLAGHSVKCAMKAELQIEHPANDFDARKQVVAFHARVTDIVSQQCGPIASGIDLYASHHDARSSLTIKGPFANGELRLNGNLNLAETVPQIVATFQMVGVELGPIAQVFAPAFPVSATATGQGTLHARWKDQALSFDAALTPILTHVRADGIPVGDITTTISCGGAYRPQRPQPLVGSLTLKTASSGVDLAVVARRFGLSSAEGSIGMHASGSIPLATLADSDTYNAAVTVHSNPLACEGMIVQPFLLNVRLQKGEINATLDEATLAIARESSRSPACFVNKLQIADSLQVRTRMVSSVPFTRAHELEAWKASVDVGVRGLELANEQIGNFTTSCRLVGGEFRVAPCCLQWRNTVCNLVGGGDLRGEARAAIQFKAGPVALQDISDFARRFSSRPLPVSGTAFATGGVLLDLRKTTFAAGGDLTLANAQYANTRIGDARLLWEANPQAAKLRIVSDDFFGGSYAVDASLRSLDWTKTSVAANARGVQIKRMIDLFGHDSPVSGLIDGGLGFGSIGELESLHADGWIRTRGASIAGTPVELQTTKLNVSNGFASVAFRGAAIDGSLNGEGSVKLADLTEWIQRERGQIHELPVHGRVQAKGMSVKHALAAFDTRRSLAPVSGKIDVICIRDETTVENGQLARVDVFAENLRLKQATMSKRLKAAVAVYPTRVEVNNIEGQFADGNLSGDAKLYFARFPSGVFRFNAKHVNLRRAAAIVPDFSRAVSGAASISMRGRLGSTSTATAKIHASNITVGDFAIRELRLPVVCSIQSQSAQVHWKSRGGSLNVGGGSVGINSEGGLIKGLASLTANVDIRRVDTTKLMRGKSLSAGIIDGTVHIQSKRARTAKDLTGRFHLELSQIQALELPGFDSLTQLVKLPTVSGPSLSQEDEGTIDGRFAGGRLHVDNGALLKSGLLVLMNGTSTLDGRLDFDVTAVTRDSGPADGLLALADSPLMVATAAPVALLIKANEAMKDRVVHVHVGGTSTRPILRLQPGKTLSQDALRFFIAGTLGSGAADVALSRQKQSIR